MRRWIVISSELLAAWTGFKQKPPYSLLLVDDLLAQQQVVIKSLESSYRQVRGLAGATILGDGRVALILDVPGLVQTFEERHAEVEAKIAAA